MTLFSNTGLTGAIESLGYSAQVKDYKPSCCASDNEDNSSSNKPVHVATIGNGSGAFACAIKAAGCGATVTIIECADIIGGCYVNVGCVLSKILIRAAQLSQQQRSNPFPGLKKSSTKTRSKVTCSTTNKQGR